jgi:ATP-dependent protease ClpP protease subunit
MKARLLSTVAFLTLAVVGTFLFCTADASAARLKHKKTGEIITGTVTKQKINKMTVFKLEDGETKFITLDEWEVLEADPEEAAPEPGPPPETASPPPAATGLKSDRIPVTKVYILPVSGTIEHYAMVEALQKGAADAKKRHATVVIFRLDTPGGRIDLGEKIVDLIEQVDDWATTVAWVKGDENHALSCGAFIALATQKIFMAPGTTLGAATPFRMGLWGVEIDEKLTSAFRARFRSLAQQRGHPVAIADAMVDNSVSVVQVFLDGKQMLVTSEEAAQMAKEHKDDTRFKRGKTVSERGKLITLTDQEALEFQICSAIVDSGQEVAKALGFENSAVEEASWIPAWVDKEQRARRALFEKCNADFETALTSAQFASSRTSSRKYIEQAAAALANIEKIVADPRYDVHIRQEEIDRMKARLQSWYEALSRP